MKKRSVLLITLLVISSATVWSQNPNLERLNDYKIAFFTRKMNLTSGEAEKFWPLYNEFQEKKRLIQENKAQINRNFNLNGQNMSDKELSDAADKYISLVMDEALLSQELNNKLKAILPPAKILRLYQAENQYKLQLLNELQNRKESRNNNMMQNRLER
ncbi:MAG: hypothetical protein ABSG89_13140 [Bacteroidales bacterium]|jgi:hypothetical protein